MKSFRYSPLFSFLLSVLLFACGDNQESQNLEIGEGMSGDSVFTLIEDTEKAEFSVALIGQWKLVDMRMDGKSYLDEPGNTRLEFKETGTMVYSADDLPTRESDFAQAGDFISAPEIWDEDLKIKNLSPTELVLTEEVSGQTVEYLYQRIDN
jgi:hypothetical protein